MNNIANYLMNTLGNPRFLPVKAVCCVGAACALLAGCATPQAPVPKAVYDFGVSLQAPNTQAALVGAASPASSSPSTPLAAPLALREPPPLPALVLPEIDAQAALDSTAVVYRLGYADAQQLRAYTLARWSMPPAQLVRQRVRDALGSQSSVLSTTEGNAPWLLKLELDEFSQLFDTPSSSAGVVRLRATLLRGGALVAQRSILARASAPTQDAAGGVRALTLATDDAVAQLGRWVAATMAQP